jgi:hypothetical protein
MARPMQWRRPHLQESAMRTAPSDPAAAYSLCFQSLAQPEQAYAFPCDAQGRVDLDGLSRASFNDYLYARALVGRLFEAPSVRGQ